MNKRHGEQNQQAFPVMMGGSSLLVIFAVLCLTVFALLSLNTVLADKRLADGAVEAVAAYYEADCRAEEIFAQLMAAQADNDQSGGSGLPEGVTCSGDIFRYSCPISETQTLWVELKRDGRTWIVLRWQAAAKSQPQEQKLEVWDGETTS